MEIQTHTRPRLWRQLLGSPCGVLAALSVGIAHITLAAAATAPDQPVGMVEQPCPPPLELPSSARDLLVELFMEPRTLTSTDFERLLKDANHDG